MPLSLLFATDAEAEINSSTNNLCQQSFEHDEKQHDEWHELTIRGDDSIFTLLKRICVSWNRAVLNKCRSFLTFIFVALLDVATRFAYSTRQERILSPSPPPTPLPVAVNSSSIRALEEELTASTASLLLESTKKQSSNMKMAQMRVQQPSQMHRTPNIAIRRNTSEQDQVSMTRSVDDRFCLSEPESTRILNYLSRFHSEPQMSIYHQSPPTTSATTEYFSKSPVFSALTSSSLVTTSSSSNEQHSDVNLHCDTIEPMATSSLSSSCVVANDSSSENSDKQLDSLSSETFFIDEVLQRQDSSSSSSTTSQTAVDDETINSSIIPNNNDLHPDRHFRRRKRRSSFTKNSFSLDSSDGSSEVNVNNKDDQEIKQELDDEHEPVLLACASPMQIEEPEIIVKDDPVQTEPTIETNTKEEEQQQPILPVSRIRSRRIRLQLYHPTVTSPLQENTSESNVDFFVPQEGCTIESPDSPLPSPCTTPPPTIISSSHTPTTSTGGLKRIGSVGASKKNVRFADSVGRELEQVQYIRSHMDDDSNQSSFLFGSSPSSSPLSLFKNHLYVPNSSRIEHKPWSFDVINPPKQPYIPPVPRRFFCLYRQPNSEHPDTYLHEVWKSQIKLEYADIRIKSYQTGEQHLVGTAWVTNASWWKYVCVKHTFNHWLNSYEHEAQYRCNSNDYRNIDQFEFSIDIPSDVDRVDYILRYAVNGQEHWDNNDGNNYTLQTEAIQASQTSISLPRDCDFNEMRFY